MSTTIEELFTLPGNMLVHPGEVLDALAMTPQFGLIEASTYDDDTQGILIAYRFIGFDDNGLALFSEAEYIPFIVDDFSQKVLVDDLQEILIWIGEHNKEEEE